METLNLHGLCDSSLPLFCVGRTPGSTQSWLGRCARPLAIQEAGPAPGFPQWSGFVVPPLRLFPSPGRSPFGGAALAALREPGTSEPGARLSGSGSARGSVRGSPASHPAAPSGQTSPRSRALAGAGAARPRPAGGVCCLQRLPTALVQTRGQRL